MGGRERIYSARIAERQGGDLGNSRSEREAARRAGWVRTRRPGVLCLRTTVTMVVLVKRGENERWEEKNHVCTMGTSSGNGFATNVNNPTAAGGMAATDVTQASEQAKTREFLTKHLFKDPEDGSHIYIYMYVYMCISICIYICIYVCILYAYLCVRICVCVHRYVYMCMCVCMHMYICIKKSMCIYMP